MQGTLPGGLGLLGGSRLGVLQQDQEIFSGLDFFGLRINTLVPLVDVVVNYINNNKTRILINREGRGVAG